LRNEIDLLDTAIEHPRSVPPGHGHCYDRRAKADRRQVGGEAVKSHPFRKMKPSPQELAHSSIDLSEPRNLLRFCTFVTIGAVASSLVIGACWVRLDYLLASLAIAGAISLIFWVVSLFALTLILLPNMAIWLFRGVVRRLSSNPGDGGGVADEWLDGPS
jgi:hypothetical protein